jgi:hypothetical protein
VCGYAIRCLRFSDVTLALNLSANEFAMQAADRLVSVKRLTTGTRRAFDVFSNKSVVVAASDGLLALSYTGPAFIGEATTDTWIAEVLCDRPVPKAQRYGSVPGIRDVGLLMRRLRDRLSAEVDFVRKGGEIAAPGFQWPRDDLRKARPVMWVIENPGRRSLRLIQMRSRHPAWRKWQCLLHPLGLNPLTGDEERDLLHKVAEAVPDGLQIESVVLNAMRKAAARAPDAIGPHCMTIVLRPWKPPQVFVRWHPAEPQSGDIGAGKPVPVGFTPWIVAPLLIAPPQLLIGRAELQSGDFVFDLQGPDVPEGGLLMRMVTQARPSKRRPATEHAQQRDLPERGESPK